MASLAFLAIAFPASLSPMSPQFQKAITLKAIISAVVNPSAIIGSTISSKPRRLRSPNRLQQRLVDKQELTDNEPGLELFEVGVVFDAVDESAAW
jgi:hypothetical protein